MIWSGVTQELRQTFQALDQAQNGDPRVIAQILEHGRNAQKQMDRIIGGLPDILGAFPEMQESMFTKDELRRCRTNAGYTSVMVGKILHSTQQIFEMLLRVHPVRPRGATRRARKDMFLYRYALATVLYFVRWIRSGSPMNRNAEKVRNDFIDLNFATVGTYFNGLMSVDKRALDVHLELRVVLERLGAHMPDDYLEGLIRQIDGNRAVTD
jgi:hypothetical protein